MPSCPDGHDSTSTDFCDVCGLAIGGSPAAPVSTVVTAPVEPDEACPECGEPRTGRFCEGCSYDFVAGASRTPSAVVSAPVAAPPVAVTATWAAVVSADRAHFEAVQEQDGPDAADIAFPAYCPDRRFTLTGDQIRIGRRSRSRGLEPEIDLTGPPADPGVSHLHAVLLAQPDGTWSLVDPGSTNGTTINDTMDPIKTDTPIPLKDGDRIHVGAWTTITVHAP
jgi:FHA domain-containing protein